VGEARQRLGPILRVDADDVALEPIIIGHQIGTVLGRVGVSRVAMVVYSDAAPDWLDDFTSAVECPAPLECPEPGDGWGRGFAGHRVPDTQPGETRLRVDGGWQVGNGRLWPLGNPELAVSDATLQASALSAELVMRGMSPLAHREDREQLLTPAAPATRRWIATRVATLTPLSDDARQAALTAWLKRLDSPDGLPGRAETAVLIAGLSHPWLRDAILVSSVHPVKRRHLADLVGNGSDAVLEVIFRADRVVKPHPERSRRACDLLTHLARSASGRNAAYPLSVLSWVSWWSGDGTWANQVNERALAADPQNTLALLVDRALAGAMPPMWVFADQPWAG
jgi:hypothetical protein